MHGMQEKVSNIVVRCGQKFPSLGPRFGITRQSLISVSRTTVWHHEARLCLVMPNRGPRDGNFCPYLTPMKDTYSLTRTVVLNQSPVLSLNILIALLALSYRFPRTRMGLALMLYYLIDRIFNTGETYI